jgi:hypothetical protein
MQQLYKIKSAYFIDAGYQSRREDLPPQWEEKLPQRGCGQQGRRGNEGRACEWSQTAEIQAVGHQTAGFRQEN